MGIPFLAVLFAQYRTCRNLRLAVAGYEAERDAYTDTAVYLLSRDVTAGEQLTRDCLALCTVKIPSDEMFTGVSDASALLGSYAKTALAKGTMLSPDLFYGDEALAERDRYLEASDIRLPDALRESDLIDVRISFPNGEDYVVLRRQKVLSLLYEESDDSACGLSFYLSEEELLRLSSARVDEALYEGAYLYAVIYGADFANAAATTYPVNPDVFSLMQWDFNILSPTALEKEQEKRSLLEEHLQAFTTKESESAVTVETVDAFPAEDNIPQM